MKKILFFISLQLCIHGIQAQNTLSYTDQESHFRKGLELFEQKAFIAAREEFKNYVEKNKNSLNPNEGSLATAEYYIALSSVYSKATDAEIEIDRFVVNHSNHPKAKVIYGDLGNHFYEEGNFEKAITYLEKATDSGIANEQTFTLKYKLGVAYFQVKDYKKALPLFQEVKSVASDYAVHAAYYSAVIQYNNGKYDAALADFRRVENVSPYKIEVPNWIANILYVQKKYDELMAYAEPIIEKPNGRKIDDICLVAAEVSYFRDDFEKSAKYYDKFRNFRRGSVSNQVTFRHGYSLFKVGEFKKALESFKKIATQTNDLGQQAAYYMGISSLKAGDMNAAMAAFDKARNANYDKAIKEEAQFSYAKVAIDLGSNQIGTNELQNYLKDYPDGKYEDEANELLSTVLFDANNLASSIAYIEGLKKRTPKINAAYQKLCYSQGVLDFNAERYEKAIQYFDKANTQPTDLTLKQNAIFWKAEAAYALKNSDAESLYNEVLRGSNESLRQKAKYGLAYLYYNNKDYKKAQSYFMDFIKVKKDESNRQNYEDAIVRVGDCNLAQKNYEEAIKYYDQAIRENRSEKDYALYQKAATLNFIGKNQEAQQIFNQISTQFPNSRLLDDSWFQNASIEIDRGNNQNAISLLSKLIKERPKSTIIPLAYQKRALAYSNLKNYEAAINDYKMIIRYGRTDIADDAIYGLQDVLNEVGRPEEFTSILEEYKRNNPQDGSVQVMEYDNAKSLYTAEKYDKAIQAFQKFMTNNPNTSNYYEAKYYIADSYFLLNDKSNALKYYSQVVSDNRTSYVSKSAMRAAQIEVGNKNYKNAISNYRSVVTSSQNKRDIVMAWQGIMEAYYILGNQDSVLVFANEILVNGGNVLMGGSNKAQLYLGKASMQKGNYIKAEEEFKKTIAMAKDNNGAEAKYFIADMQYKQKKYAESIKTLQELIKEFSDFYYWYEKGFLLVVENYIAQEDYFMAEATLKSIIENADNQDTINLAKTKLKEVQKKTKN